MKLCPNCKKQFTDAVFCQNCGTAVEDAAFCTNCGKITSLKHQFCQYCGAVKTEDGEFVARPVVEETPVVVPALEPIAEPIIETVAEPTVVEETPVAVAVEEKAEEVIEEPTIKTEEVELAEVVNLSSDEYIEIDTSNIIPKDNADIEPIVTAVSPNIETPETNMVITPTDSKETKKSKFKKFFNKKAIIISSISLFLVAAIVVGLFIFLPKKEKQYNFVLYIKDGELMFNNLDINKGEWQLSKELFDYKEESNPYSYGSWELYILISKNGKYIFYPDKLDKSAEYVNLYYRDAKNPNADAIKVAEEVRGYYVNDDATIVTYLNKDKEIYQYFVGKDKEDKIANDVKSFRVSNDGKTILYINDDNTLYVKKSGKDKEKLSADVTSIETVNEKFNTVYYRKDDTLYKHVIGKDKEKIDDNFYEICGLYDSGELYYVKYNEKTVNAWDYVEDDMAEYDANLTAPIEPTYPNYYDYYDYYYDYYGYYNYAFDYDGYQAALDKYEEEYDKYCEAYELYQSKSQRDYLREELQSSNIEITTYSLYYYDGKEEHKVSSKDIGNYSAYCAEDKPVAIYQTVGERKIKLTDITSVSDLKNKITYYGYSDYSYSVASKENELELEHDDIYSIDLTTSGNTIYYLVKDDDAEYYDEGELYKVTIKNNKISKTEEYDKASSIGFICDKYICYSKAAYQENSQSKFDLYVNKELIDRDVIGAGLFQEDKIEFAYTTEYTEAGATLNIYRDGETHKVAEDVFNAEVLPDGRIVYLCDYSKTLYTGELRIYDNGKDENLDDDVSYIINYYNIDYSCAGYNYIPAAPAYY